MRIVFAFMAMLIVLGTAYFWLSPDDTAEVSAQEVVGRACSQLERADSYVVTATITESSEDGSSSFSYLYTLEVSGDDFYILVTDLDGSNREEAKFVDGVGYVRYEYYGDTWQRADYEFHDVTTAFSGLGPDPLCPDPSRFRSIDGGGGGDAALRSYTDAPWQGEPTSTLPSTAPVPQTHQNTTHEIRVNRQGQLAQLDMTIRSRLVDSSGIIEGSVIGVSASFSGVGEANTITAPVVP